MKKTKLIIERLGNKYLGFVLFLAITLAGLCVFSVMHSPAHAPCIDASQIPQSELSCVLSEVAFNNIKTGDINDCTVYIAENDVLTPFIVLTDNYYGNALLLRKEILDQPMSINDNSSYYENSEIDKFLGCDYAFRFKGDVQNQMLTSLVWIAADDAIGTCGAQSTAISRRVFLLSFTEVVGEGLCAAVEGEQLEFFKNPNNRIAWYKGKPASWSLRSPNTYYKSVSYGIGPDGAIGGGNASDKNGIRPAFCMSPDSVIFIRDDVIEGQKCWVLE